MLPRPDAPTRRLPYTTADMSERLAKRKAEQEAAAQAKANQALRFGVTNPPAVKKDEPWYKDALGAVGGAIKSAYEWLPNEMPSTTPINMGGNAGVSMGGQGTAKSMVAEPARLAVRRAVGDITAIPRVGADSPSYTADQIRQQGVARGLLGAAIDYSQFIPVVAKGAGFASDAVNAYKLAMMERQANPFPALRGASNVIDVVEGSRLPSRVVDTPAPPATRLAQAQTNRALPPAVQRALPPAKIAPTSNEIRNSIRRFIDSVEQKTGSITNSKPTASVIAETDIKQGGIQNTPVLQVQGFYSANEPYFFNIEPGNPAYDIDKNNTNKLRGTYDKIGTNEKLIDSRGKETGVLGRSYKSDKTIFIQSPQGNAGLMYDLEERVKNGTPQPRILLKPISSAKGSPTQVRQLLDYLYGRYPNAVIDWGNIYKELPNDLFYEYSNKFPVRTLGKSISNPLENFDAPKINIDVLLDTPQRGQIPYNEIYETVGVLDNNRIYPTTKFKQLIQKFGLQGREREVLDAFARREGIVEPSRLSSWQKFVNEMQRQIDMGDYFDENPLATPASRLADAQAQRAPTPAELARLQREAARAEMGVNIQDIEFPPAPSPETLAAFAADKLSAENYMVKRVDGVDPELAKLPVEELMKIPEAKVFFDQYFMHTRTLDLGSDAFEQLHPAAWQEIGVAQEQSGFNAQQMPDQMASLRRYFSNEYPAIQSYLSNIVSDPTFSNLTAQDSQLKTSFLIKGQDETIKDMQTLVKNIDQAFEVVPPLTKPIVVYRGVGLSNLRDPYQMAFYRNLKPGDLIYDPALSSTSIDKNMAQNWAMQPDDALLIIRLPAGTKAINPISTWQYGVSEMDTHAHAPNEKELLLPRNTIFRVLKNVDNRFEVEVVLDNANATNVRTGGAKLAETMSFNDAMSTLAGNQTKQLILQRRIEKIKPIPNIDSSSIVRIGSGLFDHNLSDVNNDLNRISTKAIFTDVTNAVKDTPLDPQTNRKLLDLVFANMTEGKMSKRFFELNSKGPDLAAGANRSIVLEIEKQQAWMEKNPGKTPKPVFVNEAGGVVNNPYINNKTWLNKYFGVISNGEIYQLNPSSYNNFVDEVVKYKSINPNLITGAGHKLFEVLDQAGVLGQNKLEDLKKLYKEYVEKKYDVLDGDAYWAQEDKFWADLAEGNK